MPTDRVDSSPLWSPDAERVKATNLAQFVTAARAHGYVSPTGGAAVDYSSLYAWSVARPEQFWPAVWRFCGVVADTRPDGSQWEEVVRGVERMAPPDPAAGPRWFLGARLNFAENLLRYRDDHPALVGRSERGRGRTLTYAELSAEVTDIAAALHTSGVRAGDRVAGFMPNIPETVIAMLATASLGAVWSSCSPDFGVKGVVDRFGQIEPKVLFSADGYRYAGKEIDSLSRVREIVREVRSIRRVVVVPQLGETPGEFESWGAFRERGTGREPRLRGSSVPGSLFPVP